MTETTRTQVFTSERIAQILAGPAKRPQIPTPEQQRIIEQPIAGSVLVVAGAGSGKTETMANRVVWLVANGLVSPGEVLGLTFTRKAAGELGERIVQRLTAFTDRLIDLTERGTASEAEALRAASLGEVLSDGLELPEVSTYNSFAAGIVQEFGAFVGVGSSATLIDEAAAWRLARDVVCASDDPDLVTAGESVSTLVSRVLRLDHAVSDNLTDFDRVDRVASEFLRVGSLPRDDKSRDTSPGTVGYADLRRTLEAVEGTRLIARLARAYAAEKQRRGVLEFSDQLRRAVETVRAFPPAIAAIRERSRVVLLDEVQDTSVGQTRLLSTLFAGESVMAVGDPHQSIYGWRGASADNLNAFHRDFQEPGAPSRALTLSLSTSWRNPTTVLHAANIIAEPLNASTPFEVPRLRSRDETLGRAGSEAHATGDPVQVSEPQVEVHYPEMVHEEFAGLAEWLADARAAHERRTGNRATAAVICRSRAAMPPIAAALDAAGIPNRIVGVGGLLATPEVTDLVAALRCVWYADAGSDLIRLLVGPRFSVGIADIAGLRACARWFADRDIGQQRLSPEEREPFGALRDPDREFTLLDALDEIASMPQLDHASLHGISPTGRQRLREAGQVVRALRRTAGSGVLDLIRASIEALRLDIELDAHERSGHDGGAVAHANLDAFHDLVEDFLHTDSHGTLASVLAWLERVRELDQEAEHVPDPEPGTVQLITVHGAKGLEWDLIAIPRMVAGEFPLPSKEGRGWLRAGELPDELRGDAAARPRLNWRLATTQQELRDEIGGQKRTVKGESFITPGYVTELAERQQHEERRLAYVAITRAASRILMTGSFWGAHQTPREPSPYLRELAEARIIPQLPSTSAHTENPDNRDPRTVTWPLDPLGARRASVEAAAARVRAALDHREDEADHIVDSTVELLLAERAARRSEGDGLSSLNLPDRITASTFHEFVETPDLAYRRMQRPLPQRPYRRTRTGNRFHEWVERRTSTDKGTETPLFHLNDALDPEFMPEDLDLADRAQSADLETLIAKFNRSRWADLKPVAVEQEVTLPFAGRRLVCKLDAVYAFGPSDAERYEIVDWKTGRPPHGEAERASRFFQLDLYRHAWAHWTGVDPAHIDATLFYVADEIEVRSDGTRTLEELERDWCSAAESLIPASAGEEGRGGSAGSRGRADPRAR